MIVTTGGRGFSVSAASLVSSVWVVAYSSSRTAWNPKADAISSIVSKSSRWLIVTIWPSSLNAKVTICVGGTLSVLASSETVMNSVRGTRVFSRSRSSRRRSSWTSRNVGPSSRRWTPFLPTGAFSVASVREMFWATASWSTNDFFPFLRFLPFSRRRSSSGGAPGAAEATGRGGTAAPGPDGVPRATGRGRTGVGMKGLGAYGADGDPGGEKDGGETDGDEAEATVGEANVRFAAGATGSPDSAGARSLNSAAARSSSE